MVFCRIGAKRRGRGPEAELMALYLERIGHTFPVEAREFAAEGELLKYLDAPGRKGRAVAVLTDSTGQQVTSEGFAAELQRRIDRSPAEMVLAVGPADGWSAAALRRADLVVAFGRITLPHELAAVVLAEQTYRALTILSGHPYHCGH